MGIVGAFQGAFAVWTNHLISTGIIWFNPCTYQLVCSCSKFRCCTHVHACMLRILFILTACNHIRNAMLYKQRYFQSWSNTVHGAHYSLHQSYILYKFWLYACPWVLETRPNPIMYSYSGQISRATLYMHSLHMYTLVHT